MCIIDSFIPNSAARKRLRPKGSCTDTHIPSASILEPYTGMLDSTTLGPPLDSEITNNNDVKNMELVRP